MMNAILRAGLLLLLVFSNAVGADVDRNLPALQVRVTLSPEAERVLMQGNESITVLASWYGRPTPEKQPVADDIGQIELDRAEVILPGRGGVVTLHPAKHSSKRLGWIQGEVMVNVNVYSARRHWPDNILHCDFIDDSLRQVSQQTVILHCSLIRE